MIASRVPALVERPRQLDPPQHEPVPDGQRARRRADDHGARNRADGDRANARELLRAVEGRRMSTVPHEVALARPIRTARVRGAADPRGDGHPVARAVGGARHVARTCFVTRPSGIAQVCWMSSRDRTSPPGSRARSGSTADDGVAVFEGLASAGRRRRRRPRDGTASHVERAAPFLRRARSSRCRHRARAGDDAVVRLHGHRTARDRVLGAFLPVACSVYDGDTASAVELRGGRADLPRALVERLVRDRAAGVAAVPARGLSSRGRTRARRCRHRRVHRRVKGLGYFIRSTTRALHRTR